MQYDFPALSSGHQHALLLDESHQVWGYYPASGRNEFVLMDTDFRVLQVAASTYDSVFSVLIDFDGRLYFWGAFKHEQLRDYKFYVPTVIPIPAEITRVSCGNGFFIALDSNEDLWVLGDNNRGQLGTGNNLIVTKPTKIKTKIPSVKKIFCGYYHSFIIDEDGGVWVTGGQFKVAGKPDRNEFTQLSQTLFNSLPVEDVSGHFMHSIYLVEGGLIYGSGHNSLGELGNGTKISSPEPILLPVTNAIMIGTGYHSAVLTATGRVWSTGFNCYGQLGHSSPTNIETFTEVPNIPPMSRVFCGMYHTWFEDFDGQIWSAGKDLGACASSAKDYPHVISAPQVISSVQEKKDIKSARKK